MKKRLLTVLLATSMLIGLSACGTSTTPESSSQENAQDMDEQVEESTEDVDEAEDDGIIDFTTDAFHLKYLSHELGEDYEGNSTIVIFYEYTNLEEDAANFMFATNTKLFQNGIQLETAIAYETPDEYNNSMLDVQQGATLTVVTIHSLHDIENPITLEVSELISFNDEKDTQEIILQ